MGNRNLAAEQRRAAALEAVTTSHTLTEAARVAGISRTTLWEYLKDDDFTNELQAIRETRALARADAVEAARSSALATLQQIMTDEDTPPAARISAAQAILREAQRATDGADAACGRIISRNEMGHSFDILYG